MRMYPMYGFNFGNDFIRTRFEIIVLIYEKKNQYKRRSMNTCVLEFCILTL